MGCLGPSPAEVSGCPPSADLLLLVRHISFVPGRHGDDVHGAVRLWEAPEDRQGGPLQHVLQTPRHVEGHLLAPTGEVPGVRGEPAGEEPSVRGEPVGEEAGIHGELAGEVHPVSAGSQQARSPASAGSQQARSLASAGSRRARSPASAGSRRARCTRRLRGAGGQGHLVGGFGSEAGDHHMTLGGEHSVRNQGPILSPPPALAELI